MNAGALAGVRVLDLTSVLMGPYAAQILGDLGADVIKIEPLDGDSVREIGPHRHPGMGALFLHVNRNKRSLALDLKQAEGRAILRRLVRNADVLVHNMRPQAAARLGLDYAALAEENPRLIFAWLAGFGSGGRYAGRPAYDDLIQGASGLAHLFERAGATARYVPSAIVDRIAGLVAAQAIGFALYEREKSGRGQALEVPMFETMASLVLADHLAGETFIPPLGAMGYARHLAQHRRPYRTRDGEICVVVYNDKQWRRFFEIVDRPALASDARFASLAARSRNIDALYALVAEFLLERKTGDWLALFEDAEIPAMALNTLEDLRTDAHLEESGFWWQHEHPSEGLTRSMRYPVGFSRTPASLNKGAPRLGEHSEEILTEAGYTADEIERMRRLQVVGDGT